MHCKQQIKKLTKINLIYILKKLIEVIKMSIKIGNMELNDNKLYFRKNVVSLNHVEEFAQFIHFTRSQVYQAIFQLIEPMNIGLILEENEIKIKTGFDLSSYHFAGETYTKLLDYHYSSEYSNKQKQKNNLQLIIGYNLLLYILSEKEEYKNLDLDGFKIAKYIISSAWRSAFTTRPEFNDYIIKKYEYEERSELFMDNSCRSVPPADPRIKSEPVTLDLSNNKQVFLPVEQIFEIVSDDIILLDHYIISKHFSQILKHKINDVELFKNIPLGTSSFIIDNDSGKIKFRVYKETVYKNAEDKKNNITDTLTNFRKISIMPPLLNIVEKLKKID